MRFNKLEMIAQASQTSQIFDREGVLLLRERPDGFFRRTEGCSAKWFRLKGNLLFNLKGPEPWHEPAGLIVLGHHSVQVLSQDENERWPFNLVWENGASCRLAAFTEGERTLWINAIEISSYDHIRRLLTDLNIKLSILRPTIDIKEYRNKQGVVENMCELPLYQLAVSCDNLICDLFGHPPSPTAIVFVKNPNGPFLKYGTTETVRNNSNPNFAKNIVILSSDGITDDTLVRLLICDVREPVSNTILPIGSTTLNLGFIQAALNARVPLNTLDKRIPGFVTVSGWSLQPYFVGIPTAIPSDNQHNLAQLFNVNQQCHSLPPILCSKTKYPLHNNTFMMNFVNPYQVPYRFHSELGANVDVYEIMGESRICYQLPVQLLQIYIKREKKLVRELLAMGDVCKHWKSRLTSLVGSHIRLLKHYCYSKQALEKLCDTSFKPSSMKDEPSLEFAPVNLHLQRMWVNNDALNKTRLYDVITAGAFTAHSQKAGKTGGLFQMVQEIKDINSPKVELSCVHDRIQIEYENLLSVQKIRKQIDLCLSGILDAIRPDRINEVTYFIPALKDNVELMLTFWDVHAVKETLAMVTWKKTICTNNVFNEHTVQLADQLRESFLNRNNASEEINHRPDNQAPFGPSSSGASSNLAFHTDHFETVSINRNTESIVVQSQSPPRGFEQPPAVNVKPARTSTEPNSYDPFGPSTSAGPSAVPDNLKNLTFRLPNRPKSINRSTPLDLLRAGSVTYDGKCTTANTHMSYKSVLNLFDKEEQLKIEEILSRPSAFDSCHQCVSTNDLNMSILELYGPSLKFVLSAVCDSLMVAKEIYDSSGLPEFEVDSMKNLIRTLGDITETIFKWIRLYNVAMRLQWESPPWVRMNSELQIRRDTCFSQALTTLTTGLVSWLSSTPTATIVKILSAQIKPLCNFQALLSLHAAEKAMWGDMVVAIDDLHNVVFTLVDAESCDLAVPYLEGARNALTVYLPVAPDVFRQLTTEQLSFKVTAVFFNIGVNDKASLAEAIGENTPQHVSNLDNLDRLNNYYMQYKTLLPHCLMASSRVSFRCKTLGEVMQTLNVVMNKNTPKNVEVFQLASTATRMMNGILFTSCKSAKDRTGMAVTLDQVSVLAEEYFLAEHEKIRALDVMRSEGCRRENTLKNIGVRKYAFNKRQVAALPELYRPQPGSYGASRT